MTSTMRWLETYSSAGAALSFLIEGAPYVFATDTSAAMLAAFSSAAAPYNTFTTIGGGIKAGGEIGEEIVLYTPDIKPKTIDVTIVDFASIMVGTVLREGSIAGMRTFLTASVIAGSTAAISVHSTTGAAASGTIYIGGEAIGYTGKTATTFTGITRALNTLNQTSAGASFAPGHLIGNNVTLGATTSPAVTDFHKTWVGRFVHLLLHVKDPLTGVYNLASEATKVWTGRISSYSDNRDGSITVSAKSATDLLYRPIGPDQWRARINEGMTLVTGNTYVGVESTVTPYSVLTNLGTTGQKSHAQVAVLLNTQFAAWRTAVATSTDEWSVALVDGVEGQPPTYVFRMERAAVASGSVFFLRLHREIWNLLGWPVSGTNSQALTVTQAMARGVTSTGTYAGYYELVAPLPPIVYYYVDLSHGYTAGVASEINTFVPQASTEIDTAHPDVNGVVEVKGGKYGEPAIYAVTYTNGSPFSKIRTRGKLDLVTGKFKYFGQMQISNQENGYVRLGDSIEAPEVKQVLYYRGAAGSLLLKAALSTGGATGYNHATYDSNATAGFGAAIPASLIDVDSWEAMDDVHITLLIADPKPLYEYLEQVLAISNRYVVWKAQSPDSQPKLAITQPSLDTAFQATWQLTESNKAGKMPNRVRAERSADGIINRIVVKFGAGVDGGESNQSSITIENLASQSDYGRRKTVTIKAPIVANAEEVLAASLTPALAYFSRPLATVERSINASLIRMAPGDTVTLTDNYLVNPITGTRGAVVYCWCLSTKFNLATGIGEARLVFLPEKNPNYTGLWGPSARVDETAPTSGYVAGTKTLTLKPSEYSPAVGAALNDRQHFNVDDYVHIYALDETPPLEWFDRILSTPSSTTVVLVTGLAGWNTAKRYVMEYDDMTTSANNAQRNHAFLADATTLSTGFATPTPYEWGQVGPFGLVAGAIDYATGMAKPNTTYDDQGEPASVHKLVHAVRAANNLLRYKTRQVLLTEPFRLDQAVVGVTSTLLFQAWVPIFGHVGVDGIRGLVVRLRAKQAGGGTSTFTVVASSSPPTGAAGTGFTYPAGSHVATFATTSTTFVWSSELALTPAVFPAISSGDEPGGVQGVYLLGATGTWITVFASSSGGGVTATLNSVQVAEAES